MPPEKKLHVLIVDDTTLMRQGIKSLLEQRHSVELVGEAANPQAAAELTAGLAPDVVLLDHDIPGFDTVQTIGLLKDRMPAGEVIVLAEAPDDNEALRSLEAGANGYVLKDTDADSLVQAMGCVCTGGTFITPRVARHVMDRFRALARADKSQSTLNGHSLTAREREILSKVTQGTTDREIAREMSVSETTVKSHVRSILRKLRVRNRTQAAAYALQGGQSPAKAVGAM